MKNDTDEIYWEYFDNPTPTFSLLDDMWVERGTKEDWDQLHDLHYKAQTLPPVPHFWRCVTGDGQLVGVVVFNTVGLLLGPRHDIFPKLKPGKDTHFTNVHRAAWLNDNMRRCSRVVTDTLYRGLGISYRMLNLIMRMENYRFIEIQSSMSKFSPFDVKAGFRHAKLRHAAAYDVGLAFFRKYFECHPADHENVLNELKRFPIDMQKIVVNDMRDFYYRHSAKEKTGNNLGMGMRKIDIMTDAELVRELQQLIFASPAYGIWENPDLNRELPDRLPLRAFDWQDQNEPLKLERLTCI